MKKRLAAILYADVAAYSRLVGADEIGTIARLTKLREDVLAPLIGEHGGRIVKLLGDGYLCEFASAAGAVDCALAWQIAIADREGRADDQSRIQFRIGINLGDVVVEGDDILGDGVNIAARLEGIAEPGSVCVSEKVYREIRNKLPATANDLGPQRLKNIDEPVNAYSLHAVELKPGAPAAAEYPDKSSVSHLPKERMMAVLPFANLTGDPSDEHLCDSLATEIITVLSWMQDVTVVARHSSFALGNKGKTVAAIGRELGVGYVLEGNLRRLAQRLRVTVQLVAVGNGAVLWTERYDRDLADVFAVLDDIARQVATALQTKIGVEESARYHASVRDPQASALVVQATGEEVKFTRESNVRTRELLGQALAIEPESPGILAELAWVNLAAAHYGYVADAEQALELARSIAERMLALPEERDTAHAILGWYSVQRRDYDRATEHGETAIRLHPNHASNQHVMSMIQVLLGNADEALRRFRIAARLNPNYPAWYLWPLCDSYRLIGDVRAYRETARRYVARMPGFYGALLRLVGALVQSGLVEEAAARAKEVLEISPDFRLSHMSTVLPFRDRTHLDSYVADLRLAGLPA